MPYDGDGYNTILVALLQYRMIEIIHDIISRHLLAALIDGDRYNAVLVASIDGDQSQYCKMEIVHDTVLAASINGDYYSAVPTCGARNTVG